MKSVVELGWFEVRSIILFKAVQAKFMGVGSWEQKR